MLVSRQGEEHKGMAFALESITSAVEQVDVSAAAKLFSHVKLSDVERPEGPVDLLLGLNYANLH